ncbi:tape measure protein [Deinococcus sp. 6GRE01]|uniref:tape measure protein n=1 Tax=Deinococcus sp. 6GRE01 TaxID=2745873 RepID=UPI001E5C8C29|nr:tape measure protein [Deinococcus sp. 6GRE01]MCD0156010.1 transglycosylase SLT domain-containing protein [Deinococcus sp. 6GRE01]
MATAVEWTLRLVDRLSGPARRMIGVTDTLEARLDRIERTLNGVAREQDRAGRAGEAAANRMDRAYARTEGRLARIRTGVIEFTKTSAKLGLGAATVGAGAFTRAAVGGMSQREGNLMSLGTLLKTQDAAKVRSASDWVSQFADVTPFEDPQVMNSVRQLLASQFTFAQTQGIARITGNTASALGGDPADAAFKWEIINRALGQIKAKGRVQGDELLQLQEAGVGTNAYLEKYVGKDYRDLMQKGQLSAGKGISAILRGLEDDFGGSMERMSTTFGGMLSTLASRPKRIFSQMFDDGGLKQPKRLLQNLVNMTDFSKAPGSRILSRLSKLGGTLVSSVFGPLADATSGNRGARAIDDLLDRLDRLAAWAQAHGPFLRNVLTGIGDGLMFIWGAAKLFLKPIEKVLRAMGLLSGNEDTGKFVGYLIAGAIALKAFGLTLGFLVGPVPAIIRLFGAITVLNAALPMLAASGVISATALTRLQAIMRPLLATTRVFAILTGGWRGALIGIAFAGGRMMSAFMMPLLAGWGRFTRLLGAGRGFFAAVRGAALFASRFGWIARLLPLISNPIGWIVLAVTALVALGVTLYRKWEPFRTFVDNLADGFRVAARWAVDAFLDLPDKLRGLGARLYDAILPQWLRDALAKIGINVIDPTAIDPNFGKAPAPALGMGTNASITALTGVANRLGIDPQALLAVAFKESSLNAGAVNAKSGASGLIQFLPSTARALGTSVEAIRKMTPEQQAPYIEAYLRQAGVGQGSNLEQVYAAVFAGSASKTGRVLYTAADGRAYSDNIGLDLDKNGEITSAEAANAAARAWGGVAPTFAPNVTINVGTVGTGQAVADLGATTQQALLQVHNTLALEQGVGGGR